jgi:hypothetical protein
MVLRKASCRCGALSATCEGEPIRVSICHCFACQQRSGSPFGEQARFPADKVSISGNSSQWVRIGDGGGEIRYHFCPVCPSTVWYQGGPMSDAIAIPVGLFCDPSFPPPRHSVWEARKHPWLRIDAEVEHID